MYWTSQNRIEYSVMVLPTRLQPSTVSFLCQGTLLTCSIWHPLGSCILFHGVSSHTAEFHPIIPSSHFFHPVLILLNSSPAHKPMNHFHQFCIICKLADSSSFSIIQIIKRLDSISLYTKLWGMQLIISH